MPELVTVTFVDNCGQDFEVEATTEELGGSVCTGSKTWRKWKGPKDECGNEAVEVLQVITVLDQEEPKLPESLEPLVYTCPADFELSKLAEPEATDDCDDSVTVTAQAPALVGCKPFNITWTATDDCEKESTIDQMVRKILHFHQSFFAI